MSVFILVKVLQIDEDFFASQVEQPKEEPQNEFLKQKNNFKVIQYMPGKSQAIDTLVNTSSFSKQVDYSEKY